VDGECVEERGSMMIDWARIGGGVKDRERVDEKGHKE
jgi:hypothetical protein